MTHPVLVRTPFTIRDGEEADMPTVAAIYGHYVYTSFATFEEVPPPATDLARRRTDALAMGAPFLVACDAQGTVLGFAYASYYRQRSAYRFTLEDSIYVAPGATRRGIGQALLMALIERCTAAGFRLMVAVIGDTANAASIGLHEKVGFRRAGLLPAVGFKLGRWIDNVIMQRALGPGSATAPLKKP